MTVTQTSRWTLASSLALFAGAIAIGALAIPPSRWISTLSALAALAGISAGAAQAFASEGPQIQRRVLLGSFTLLACAFGLMVRMILHGLVH